MYIKHIFQTYIWQQNLSVNVSLQHRPHAGKDHVRVCCDSDGVNVLKYETISRRFWDLIQTLLSLSHFYGILPAANMIQSTQQKILPFIIPPHLGENIFLWMGITGRMLMWQWTVLFNQSLYVFNIEIPVSSRFL